MGFVHGPDGVKSSRWRGSVGGMWCSDPTSMDSWQTFFTSYRWPNKRQMVNFHGPDGVKSYYVYSIHGAGSNLSQHVQNFGRINTEYVPYNCRCSGCFSNRSRSVVVHPTSNTRFCALVVLVVIGPCMAPDWSFLAPYMTPGSCWIFPGSYRVTDSYISHEICVVIAS